MSCTLLIRQCQPTGIQHLRPSHFVAETASLLVSNDQDRFKCHNRRRSQPSDIGNGKEQLGHRKGKIADDGFPKSCRLT